MGLTTAIKLDLYHSSNLVTRRSITLVAVCLNSAPFHWYSKKQKSVEMLSFGSEFITMRQSFEYDQGLACKLKMMGISCEDSACACVDNKSVLANDSVPESALKNKSSSLAYHLIREGAAIDDWRTMHVNTHDDEACVITKFLTFG